MKVKDTEIALYFIYRQIYEHLQLVCANQQVIFASTSQSFFMLCNKKSAVNGLQFSHLYLLAFVLCWSH